MSILHQLGTRLKLQVARHIGRQHTLVLSTTAQRKLNTLLPQQGLMIERLRGIHGDLLLCRPRRISQADQGLAIRYDPSLAPKLAGLLLDYDDGRWRFRDCTTVRVSATPNPQAHRYQLSRRIAQGHVTFTDLSAPLPPVARILLSRGDIVRVFVRDHTLSVLRTPNAPWSRIDQAVTDAIHAHFQCGFGEIAEPDKHALDTTLARRLEPVIQTHIRPRLQRDGGDMELIEIDHGVARVRLIGACHTCPAALLTMRYTVERILCEHFPDDIDAVEAVMN